MTRSNTKQKKKRGGFGLLPVVALALMVLVGVDFFLFAERAANARPDVNARADAIVALTGGSGFRIAAGVELVATGRGERLLVSGVHPDVGAAALQDLAGGPAETWACCVDVGHVAETTLGNADEAAAWAYERGYDSLILVTSDYHMPRSLLVLQAAMPDIQLVPWPVRTVNDPAAVWSDGKSFRGVFVEWMKWRVTTLG